LKTEIKIYKNAFLLGDSFADEFCKKSKEYSKNKINFNVALSGGKTPVMIFEILSLRFEKKINWKNIQFYWVDERSVPPYDHESNYGMAKKLLLDNIDIPESNIHRIKGEEEPGHEALRYSDEIISNVPFENGLPSLDLVMLGLGEDGHTASIFPNQIQLINSDKICDVSVNPYTNQKRITLTGTIINNAKTILFIVSGSKKKEIVYKILNKSDGYKVLPASNINPVFGETQWMLDADAAALLNNKLN
jgi:6-phosphogluconolactonase